LAFCRRAIVCVPLLELGAGCGAQARDPQAEWADYKLAVARCAGSWRLAPVSTPIPGAPACIDTLAIEFSIPDQPPSAFALDDPPGTASVAFCGHPETFSIDSVVVGHQVAVQSSGSTGASPLGEATFEFQCSSSSDASRHLSLRWRPSPFFGAGSESVAVAFAEPEWRHDGRDSEVSSRSIPVLGFVR